MIAAEARRPRHSSQALVLVLGALLALATAYAGERGRQVRNEQIQDVTERRQRLIVAMLASIRDRGGRGLVPEDEGSRVRVAGPLTVAGPVTDPETGVGANGFALDREVQYFRANRPGGADLLDNPEALERARANMPDPRSYAIFLARLEAERAIGGSWVATPLPSATPGLPRLPPNAQIRNPTTRIGGTPLDPALVPAPSCLTSDPVPEALNMLTKRFPALRVAAAPPDPVRAEIARQYPERRPEPELEWVVLASGPAGLRQGDLRLRYRTLACELSAKAMVGLQRDGRLVPAGQGPRLWAAMPAGTTALEFVHQLLPPEVDGMPDPEDARFTAGCLGWTVLVLALLLVVRDRARARRAQAAAMASLQVIGPPRPAGAADPGGKGPGGIPGYVVLLLGLLGAYLAVQVLTGLGWIMAQGAVGLVGGAGVALAAAGLALARLPPDWLKPGVAAPGGG